MATVFKRGGRKAKGGNYYYSYVDYRGRRRTRSAKTTDADAARRIANKKQADAALRREGVVDPRLEELAEQSRRSVEAHLADYEAMLRVAGRTKGHITRTCRFVRDAAKAAGFEAVGDIAADRINHYGQELLKRRSARTVAARLTAIKAFTSWLAAKGKLLSDPLGKSVPKPSSKSDRRILRRMLLPEEWQWLRSVALADQVERCRMSADERILLYAVAIQTGLRAGELRSLTRGALFLSGERPYVTCKAGSTKNRKDARQYIRPELAKELRRQVAAKAPATPVFAMPRKDLIAGILRADLAAARRAWLKAARRDPEEYQRREQSDFLLPVNHEKEVLDFHSLRHTCGAWLVRSGTDPKTVQTIMRHSLITLTMDTYGHLFPGQEAEAVARLPDLLSDPEPEAARATGTYDQAPLAVGKSRAQRKSQAQGAGNGLPWREVAKPFEAPPRGRAAKLISPTSCQWPR